MGTFRYHAFAERKLCWMIDFHATLAVSAPATRDIRSRLQQDIPMLEWVREIDGRRISLVDWSLWLRFGKDKIAGVDTLACQGSLKRLSGLRVVEYGVN